MDNSFNIFDDSYISNIANNNNDKKNPITIINNDKKKKEKKSKSLKELKKSIPKRLRKPKYQPTEEQKLRIFKNYIQPKLTDNNTNDPNNDLVQSLKDAFGKDNKEKLNEVLPTFSYQNDLVDNQLLNNKEFEKQQREDERIRRYQEKKNDIHKLVSKTKYNDKTFPSDKIDAGLLLRLNENIAVEKLQNALRNDKTFPSEKIDTGLLSRFNENNAVTTIQNALRNKIAKKKLQNAQYQNYFDNSAATTLQKTFRGHRLRKEIESELTQAEKDIKHPEKSVSAVKQSINEKHGYQLRKTKANELAKIHQIVHSPKSKEEKNRLLEPRMKKIEHLENVIIPKKRGPKPGAKA